MITLPTVPHPSNTTSEVESPARQPLWLVARLAELADYRPAACENCGSDTADTWRRRIYEGHYRVVCCDSFACERRQAARDADCDAHYAQRFGEVA